MEKLKITVNIDGWEQILKVRNLQTILSLTAKDIVEKSIDLYFDEIKKKYPNKFEQLAQDTEGLLRTQ